MNTSGSPAAAPPPLPPSGETPAAYFSARLPDIERAIAFVVRRRRLGPDMAADFASIVHLRLLEHDCAVLRKFEGRSRLQTFLVVVVQRLFLDYRVGMWGKWRPSAEARDLGPLGVKLDRLRSRERLTFEEASACLRVGERHGADERELWSMWARLPARAPRRFVAEAAAAMVPADAISPDLALMRRHAGATRVALRRAMDRLDADDRRLLALRFAGDRRVADIARVTTADPKGLYRRFDRLLQRLRVDLQAQGISAADVREWLGQLPMTARTQGDNRPSSAA
jgi:RNA polymerase sigma factor (sigma-70 family)